MATPAAAKPATMFATASGKPSLLTRVVTLTPRKLASIPPVTPSPREGAAAPLLHPSPSSPSTPSGLAPQRFCTLTEDGQLPGAPLPPSEADGAFVPSPGVADEALLAVLTSPVHTAECATEGFARKERELVAILATLMPADSFRLERRLASPIPGDVLAAEFQRLIVTRRNRLLSFLSTSRHRASARR